MMLGRGFYWAAPRREDLNAYPKVHTPFSTLYLARLSLPPRLPILYIVSFFFFPFFLYHDLLNCFVYLVTPRRALLSFFSHIHF